MFRSGFITLLGKPNVGKSTLTNRLVGEKVSIVSNRPQTTRDKIVGIVNKEGMQAVILDTPGVHKPKNMLSEYMMKSVEAAQDGVDVYVYIIACDKRLDSYDVDYIRRLATRGKPLIVVVNKCDETDRKNILERIDALKDLEGVKAIVPISAKNGKNCDLLEKEIYDALPEGQPYYAEDMYTDKSMRFMAAEIVREKALRLLGEEVPYGIGVSINKFEYRADGIVEIDADVICEKQAHKAIVIGKGGDMIKKISTQARYDIEKMTGQHVFLTLYVRVKPDWRDSNPMLNELGYSQKNI